MKASCRVYLVTHADGRCTGILMSRSAGFFDPPPPMAYGESGDDVLERLDIELKAREATGEPVARYFWEVEVRTRTVEVPIHAQRAVDKRVVIGRRELPLRLTYAYSPLAAGGFRLDLPRFGWWLVVEDLEVAPTVLAYAVSGALLGEKPRFAFDFRHEGRERVAAWTPRLVARPARLSDEPIEITPAVPPALAAVAEDWVDLARRRRLPAVVGAEPHFEAIVTAAGQAMPPSYVLIGPPGVGKTTWVRRLARGLGKRKPGRGERRKRLWATHRDRLIAGMVYLGQWQERALAIVDALRLEGDLLYVGRLADFIAPQPDGTSLAEMFESAFLAGEISLIAEATAAEFRVAQRRAPRFVDRFEQWWLFAPDERELVELIGTYQERLDRTVSLAPEATRRLLRHLTRFRPDQGFPGKALQFLDWHHGVREAGGAGVVPAATLDRRFARWSGLPAALVAEDEAAPARAVAAALGAEVIGQPDAVQAVAEVVARFKAGLNDPGRPLGTLLFAGPTGVGKTQLAKALARWLFGDAGRLVRADMSEYMLPGSARRLFAAEGGVTSIATRVRDAPLSVVLLDEIEKAHPEVFDALLSVLGEGRLCDTGGREVSFRMTVIIMTSNLGAGDKPLAGFSGGGRPTSVDFGGAVRRHFRPELINRLDRVVAFAALDQAALERIVDLELARVGERTGLVRRGLGLAVSPAAKATLARWGHDPEMGARPLKRVVEERVVTPIAALLARQPELAGATLRVDVDGEALTLTVG